MTTDTRRRVKLYALNAERQWDDRGTGHVSSNYVDRLKGISLLVRAESDGSLLLESKIQPDTAYQKQQDTLIVWSEGDNFDLALSFQEKAGCDEIWEKICQVQGKDPSVDITQDIVEESEDERYEELSDSAPPIELPPCELARLEDISEAIANGLTSPLRKEKLAMALETDTYIKKLLSLFHMCEDLDNLEGLHHLYEIFKNIFMLNKNALFEIMFAEDTIFEVVGCLEYDPGLQQPKKHRQFLKQLARFREAIPIKNQELLNKIHQTYRVQYIQDIILPAPSVFVEDNILNTLSSFIFFNKVEIVTIIQEDENFLVELFTVLTDPNTADTKRRDIVMFLKEFCTFAQNLQPQPKDSFYKTLTCLGILSALEITLVMNDQGTKSASIDILTAIVEYSPCIIRNYTLQQANKTEERNLLLNIVIEQMLSDSEPELGGAVQLMGVIRILLDPENMLTEKQDFLNFFYKHSIQTLIAPLLTNTTGDQPQNEDYQTVQLLGLVLELLSFCVEHHAYHIKNFITNKDLLKRILVLMKSTHTFLVLGALRLLRKIIAIKDDFYNRHIVKYNLFAPVVDAFIRNNGRYNLLESAILELFDFIKLEDIKILCNYIVENFIKIFDEIEYVQTFKHIKARYEQHQELVKDKLSENSSIIPMIRNNRYRRDTRQLEEEEEIWFNEEEDFTDVQTKPEIESYSMIKNNKGPEKNGPVAVASKSNVNSSSATQTEIDSSTTSTSYPSTCSTNVTPSTMSSSLTSNSSSSSSSSSGSSSPTASPSSSPPSLSQQSQPNPQPQLQSQQQPDVTSAIPIVSQSSQITPAEQSEQPDSSTELLKDSTAVSEVSQSDASEKLPVSDAKCLTDAEPAEADADQKKTTTDDLKPVVSAVNGDDKPVVAITTTNEKTNDESLDNIAVCENAIVDSPTSTTSPTMTSMELDAPDTNGEVECPETAVKSTKPSPDEDSDKVSVTITTTTTTITTAGGSTSNSTVVKEVESEGGVIDMDIVSTNSATTKPDKINIAPDVPEPSLLLKTPPLVENIIKKLVDYDGGDSDDEYEEENGSPSPKKARFV